MDWLAGGPFFYQWRDGRLTSVMHRKSGLEVAVPQHIVILSTFELESPMCDTLAAFVKSPFKQLVCSFFNAGEGPNLAAFDKKGKEMKNLCAMALAEMQERKSQASADTHEKVILKDHAKEKKIAALAAARQQMAQRPAKRARTLTMELQEG